MLYPAVRDGMRRFSSVNTPTPTTQTQACQGSALRWHPEFPPQRRQHCISTGLLGEGSGSGVHESSGDLLGQQLGRRLGRKDLLAWAKAWEKSWVKVCAKGLPLGLAFGLALGSGFGHALGSHFGPVFGLGFRS